MAKIDEEIKTKFANDKHRFITNLIYTSHAFQNLVADFLKPYGISSQQFNILRILRGNGSWVTMSKIKNLMMDKAPNATRLSDKLLDKGLVERKRSETDRRIVYLKLTKSGVELLAKIDADDSGVHTKYFERITEKEAREISAVLDRMRG
jgi:DNA-binding MarR family transcriptional regulator